MLELSESDGRRDVRHAEIVSQHRVPIPSGRVHPLAAYKTAALGQFRVVGDDHAALAGGHDLVAKEAKGSGRSERTDGTPFVQGALGFGAVLEHPEMVGPREG